MDRNVKYNFLFVGCMYTILAPQHVPRYLQPEASGITNSCTHCRLLLPSIFWYEFNMNLICSVSTLQRPLPKNTWLNPVWRRRIQWIIFMMALCLKNRSPLTGTRLLHIILSFKFPAITNILFMDLKLY